MHPTNRINLITLGLGAVLAGSVVLNSCVQNAITDKTVARWNQAANQIREYRRADNQYDANELFTSEMESVNTFNRVNFPDLQIPTDTISLARSNLCYAFTNKYDQPLR